MTDYLTLTEFVPGTKAKAQDVNANFAAVKDAINGKAALAGDYTQTFSVASGTDSSHAVNKEQLEGLSENLTLKINATSAKFCVKSGNTTNGVGDLFSYEVLRLTPKVGGTYANLVISDYAGTLSTISSVDYISMSGKPDGTYNVFITPDGTLYTLSNKIYKQNARPTMVDGDIWLDISIEQFYAIKYDGTNDNEFLDVPLGTVTIASGAITAVTTFPFNDDGFNINSQCKLNSGTKLISSITNLTMPDFANGISKSTATQQAECDGYLFVYGFTPYAYGQGVYIGESSSNVNTLVAYFGWDISAVGGTTYNSCFIPISKGTWYRTSGFSTVYITFYPSKGVN